jgi:hypothetical protein
MNVFGHDDSDGDDDHGGSGGGEGGGGGDDNDNRLCRNQNKGYTPYTCCCSVIYDASSRACSNSLGGFNTCIKAEA